MLQAAAPLDRQAGLPASIGHVLPANARLLPERRLPRQPKVRRLHVLVRERRRLLHEQVPLGQLQQVRLHQDVPGLQHAHSTPEHLHASSRDLDHDNDQRSDNNDNDDERLPPHRLQRLRPPLRQPELGLRRRQVRRRHTAPLRDVQRPGVRLEAEPLQAVHEQGLERMPELPAQWRAQGLPGRVQCAVHGVREYVCGRLQERRAGGLVLWGFDQVLESEGRLLEG